MGGVSNHLVTAAAGEGRVVLALIVGYIVRQSSQTGDSTTTSRRPAMKVSDILRVKGGTLYTCTPDETLNRAVQTMSEFDIGSLAVMDHGELAGMLTFREVIHTLARNGGSLGNQTVRTVMDPHPASCTPETELDQVRPMMLERHTRYMPVMDDKMLMGVISFYDVAKAVVDSQNFENKMLKAYIRDWPEGEEDSRQSTAHPS
jgi:CBS domain-containing protein